MKKIFTVSFGLLVLVLSGIYFLLPETLFNLAVKAGRYSAGLAKKEIQVDVHTIVYPEGGKGDADKILDVGGVAVLEKNLKNYQTVIMKDTGHIPMWEKPRKTASYYLSYLKGKK